jgi:hypothetical protein
VILEDEMSDDYYYSGQYAEEQVEAEAQAKEAAHRQGPWHVSEYTEDQPEVCRTTPYWRPSPDKPWFAHCPDNGFEFFATEGEALEAGAEFIQSWLDDGWAEEVRDVFVGKAIHVSTQCDRVDRPDNLDEDGIDDEGRYWDPDWDYVCNYRLERLSGCGAAPKQSLATHDAEVIEQMLSNMLYEKGMTASHYKCVELVRWIRNYVNQLRQQAKCE